MTRAKGSMPVVSLLSPTSSTSTRSNKTGSWSYVQPSYLEKTAPCSEACPCAEDIPRVEMLASRGLFAAAWRTILEENPFPGVCGRVCFRRCESKCNRGELDEAVSINALERFLSDAAAADGSASGIEAATGAGKRVAVLGAGPAGLSAAYFLARLGYACEVLEAAPEAGGLLRYGIPSYRLPAAALDRDIERITRLGVVLRAGSRAGSAGPREAGSGFDATVVACGNARPARLGVPGEELAEEALAFLARVRSGRAAELSGKRVAVVGGGNGAIDAARTALRLGASVTIVYRRRREDMPAFDEEVREALAEGVRLVELRSPASIARSGGNGLSLSLKPMRIAGAGPDGRGRVEADPGLPPEKLAFDAVYAALGAAPDPGWVPAASALKLGRCALELEGPRPTAFVGDLVSGGLEGMEESVADAVASGKEAAIALDAFFKKGAASVRPEVERSRVGGGSSVSMELYRGGERARRSRRVVSFAEINVDYFAPRPRERGASLAPAVAARGFSELRAALSAKAATAQAERCFNCGVCNGCDNCRTFCPEVAVRVSGEERSVDTDYCKGCGICLAECPRNAMAMGEGEKS